MFNHQRYWTHDQVDVAFLHLRYFLSIELDPTLIEIQFTQAEIFLLHTAIERFLNGHSFPKVYVEQYLKLSDLLRGKLQSTDSRLFPKADLHCNYILEFYRTAAATQLIDPECDENESEEDSDD